MQVYSSIRECDLEIAEYAFRNKCMAILAQDSDFVIFNSANYYWSMKHFNLHRMTTKTYDRNILASILGITTNHLPLLASLLGNDVISYDDLQVLKTINCVTLEFYHCQQFFLFLAISSIIVKEY